MRTIVLSIEQAAERNIERGKGSRNLGVGCDSSTYHRTTRGLLIEAICHDQLLSFADQYLKKWMKNMQYV